MTSAPIVGFFHACVGYPDGQCHCFHPWAEVNGRPVPDHTCPEPLGPGLGSDLGEGASMEDPVTVAGKLVGEVSLP